jgi:hypothetical protein
VSDRSNAWSVTGVKVDSRQMYDGRGQELVIEAQPAYGNAKKWQGEFRFALTAEQLDDLKKTLDGESQKARLIEVAHSELKAIKEEFKEEYRDKLAEVLKDTGLTEDDLDSWDRHL